MRVGSLAFALPHGVGRAADRRPRGRAGSKLVMTDRCEVLKTSAQITRSGVGDGGETGHLTTVRSIVVR